LLLSGKMGIKIPAPMYIGAVGFWSMRGFPRGCSRRETGTIPWGERWVW